MAPCHRRTPQRATLRQTCGAGDSRVRRRGGCMGFVVGSSSVDAAVATRPPAGAFRGVRSKREIMIEPLEIGSKPVLRFGPWVIAGLIMTAVLVNAADYSFLVPLRDVRVEAHQQVVAHTAQAPAKYRVLVPAALDVPIRAFGTVMPYDKAFGRVYAVFHFAALVTLLGLLVYELLLWFTIEQAMVGALLVGSTIRMALRQGEY